MGPGACGGITPAPGPGLELAAVPGSVHGAVDFVGGAAGDEKKTHARRGRDWQTLADGSEIFRDWYDPGDGKEPFNTWYLRCPRHGRLCYRRREVRPKASAKHGELECVAYLECWKCSTGVPDVRETHAYKPTPKDVDDWMAEHSAAYLAVNGHALAVCGLRL